MEGLVCLQCALCESVIVITRMISRGDRRRERMIHTLREREELTMSESR